VYVAADLQLQLFSLPPVPKVPKAEAVTFQVGLIETPKDVRPPPPVSIASIVVDLGEAAHRAAAIQKPDGSKSLLHTRAGRTGGPLFSLKSEG
jgi:hypothetical protein